MKDCLKTVQPRMEYSLRIDDCLKTVQLNMGFSSKVEDCLKTVQQSMEGWIEDERLSDDSTAK